MTLLRTTANRIFVQTSPYTRKYPVYSETVFYHTGSIVARSFQVSDSDSDSVYYNYYVSQRDIMPGGLYPEQNNSGWILWVSGDPKFEIFYTDSDIYTYIDGAAQEYQTRFVQIDSDLSSLRNEFENILNFDSDIKEIQRDIRYLEERNIIDSLIDSEASHLKAISWDSDQQKFKFITPVLSVNNTLPDAEGNVSYKLGKTKVGTRDDRLDSDVNGTIFVVLNDSDSEANGFTYSFTDVGWVRTVGYADRENEVKYVKLIGDTMLGPLFLAREPIEDSEAVTKFYVDNFTDSDKQDKIIILNTIADFVAVQKTEGRIYFVKEDNTVWLYTGGSIKKFIIPAERIFDPVLLEARAINKTATYFDVIVRTYRFSDQTGGTLSLYRNNSTTPTIFIRNANLDGDYNVTNQVVNAKLTNAANQSFTIRVATTFLTTDIWRLDFYSHDGIFNSITIDGTDNKVSFSESNRIFNFGEY